MNDSGAGTRKMAMLDGKEGQGRTRRVTSEKSLEQILQRPEELSDTQCDRSGFIEH